MHRQAGQGGQRRRAAGAVAIGVDIHLVVAEEELVQEGAIGECCHGITQIPGGETHLGRAAPDGADFNQGLGQRQAGGLGLDARIVEDGFRFPIQRSCHIINLSQIFTRHIQRHAAGAAIVAGNDRAACREGTHTRVLPVNLGNPVHHRFHMGRVHGFSDDAQVLGADAQVHVFEWWHEQFAAIIGLRVLAYQRQQFCFHFVSNRGHGLEIVAGRGVHAGKGLGLFPLGQIFRWGRQEHHNGGGNRQRNAQGGKLAWAGGR